MIDRNRSPRNCRARFSSRLKRRSAGGALRTESSHCDLSSDGAPSLLRSQCELSVRRAPPADRRFSREEKRARQLRGERLRSIILGSPGSFSGKRGEPDDRAKVERADGTLQGWWVSLERSRTQRELCWQALTMRRETVMIRGCHGNVKAHKILTLFDNREWNQNVRGELEVARGLQGP